MKPSATELDLSRAVWRKSTASENANACVEVARVGGFVAVRDSKNPDGPKLVFGAREWAAFADGVKAGDFDRLA
ncbi:DUF397 domain-containing protein [Carbonactinospora thermoautotrophica]|nr:DUF397 domain-containing protein [Carbonactinospora thermoautotrophica]